MNCLIRIKSPTRAIALLWLLLVVFISFDSAPVPGQEQAKNQQGARRWHPLRVPAGTEFTGSQACAECHRNKTLSQANTSMGRALEAVAQSQILTAHPKLKFQLGKYSYEITRRGDQSIYTVSDGAETISLPIRYVFGQGKAGQTWVLEREGWFYESRLNFYNDIKGLDLTIGTARSAPQSLKEAVGREIPASETLQCFGCHATASVSGGRLQLDKMHLGISCEGCHGPGGEHVAAGKAGQPNREKIFNPGRLSGDELTQDFCAACHRGVEDVTALRNIGGINNVRFQPYRIFSSKCYSDDRRIGCTACHNPHEPLREDAAYYDAQCLACHTANKAAGAVAASQCPKGTGSCISCHMPKIEPPGAHFKFTDHRIRIVRPGEPYPN